MSDRAAIVTGSSRGIGRAVALRLAKEGYSVVVNGTTEGGMAEALGMISDAGGAAVGVAGDIGDRETHGRLLNAAEGLGELHCLVNNAGVSVLSRGDLLEVGEESYDRCMRINARGSFFLTQAAAKLMLGQGQPAEGHRSIVFISSINAIAASVSRGEYCMTKAAVSMATRLYALRLAGDGIGVYEIQPGLIRTDMTAPSGAKYDKMIEEGFLPIPRWGEPEDIAETAASMAAGSMRYAVGQAVQLDGGLSVTRF